MEKIITKFHENKSHSREFNQTFNTNLSNFLNPLTGFDIIAFDDRLKNQYGNYEDGKTSMSDFIKKKFGENAIKLIDKLI